METNIFNNQNSLLNTFIAELRNKDIQKDSMRFRRNIQRIGEIMAYEISKTLNYKSVEVQTPLGSLNQSLPDEDIVVATILRAGLPLHQGVLNYFDRAESSFISAYRKYKERNNFDVHIEYMSSPSLKGKTVILTDPMLASGVSMELAYKAILTSGEPVHTHIVSVIASQEGVEYIQKHLPQDNVTIWIAAVDEEMNEKKYIIPGLGDAGDLAFGEKL